MLGFTPAKIAAYIQMHVKSTAYSFSEETNKTQTAKQNPPPPPPPKHNNRPKFLSSVAFDPWQYRSSL